MMITYRGCILHDPESGKWIHALYGTDRVRLQYAQAGPLDFWYVEL